MTLDVAEDDLAHQAHVGRADERVLGLVAQEDRKLQRLPRARQPVHRHHRDIGRGFGHRGLDPVVDGAQMPEELLVHRRHEFRHLRLHVGDAVAGGEKQRHLLGIRHHEVGPELRERGLPLRGIGERCAHRLRGFRPERRGPRAGFGVAAGDDEILEGARIDTRLVRQKELTEPRPDRRDAGARDAALLLGGARRGRKQILERQAEMALRRRRALRTHGAAQHGAQTVEDHVVGQRLAVGETVDLHGARELGRNRFGQSAQKRFEEPAAFLRDHLNPRQPAFSRPHPMLTPD